MSANLPENRETVALLPIFDEKRHPGRTEEQMEMAKKSLFMKCMEVSSCVCTIPCFQNDGMIILPNPTVGDSGAIAA